jgi:hypothetical protein
MHRYPQILVRLAGLRKPGNQLGTGFQRIAVEVTVVSVVLGLAAPWPTPPAPVEAFGTVNGILGQRAEHERITRAALACPPGVRSTGDCFEPRSIDQLAGTTGTFGAVGAPDGDEFMTEHAKAHCDNADFLTGDRSGPGVAPPYPQTREQRRAALQECVNHLRMRFHQGVDAANDMLTLDGERRGFHVNLTPSCTFVGGAIGRAKCNTLEGLGRALHGVQDFYSHSNWTDHPVASTFYHPALPPGLNLSAPSSLLDLKDPMPVSIAEQSIPNDFTTGYFPGLLGDNCTNARNLWFSTDLPEPRKDIRILHDCLNKDKVKIQPSLESQPFSIANDVVVTEPGTFRGEMKGQDPASKTNAERSVRAAILDTKRQWNDFRDALKAKYGEERGGKMILALTQDFDWHWVEQLDVLLGPPDPGQRLWDRKFGRNSRQPSQATFGLGSPRNAVVLETIMTGVGRAPDSDLVVGSVRLDGVLLPPGSITRVTNELNRIVYTFNLGNLSAGTHTVTSDWVIGPNVPCYAQGSLEVHLDSRTVVGHLATHRAPFAVRCS